MKKKLLMSGLVVIICMILVGCGKTESNNNGNNQGYANVNNGTTSLNGNYDYSVAGKLTQIVDEDGNPKQADFVIDGIILVGNRHSYAGLEADSEGIVEKLAAQGYLTEGINSSFYLNEWIEFYIDTKYTGASKNVKILITPHRTVEELEKMSLSKLEELAENNGGYVIDYKTPETDNYYYVGNGYVNMDYPEGDYDILFTYKGKLAYFINITETKEPTE